MGRWVTSKGKRIYIPDEGEEVPEKYKKNVVKGMTTGKGATSKKESASQNKTAKTISDNEAKKEKQIATNKAQAEAAEGKSSSEPKWMQNYSRLSISKEDTKGASAFTETSWGKVDDKAASKMLETIKSGSSDHVVVKSPEGKTVLSIRKNGDVYEASYVTRRTSMGNSYGNAVVEKKKFKTSKGAEDFVAHWYQIGQYGDKTASSTLVASGSSRLKTMYRHAKSSEEKKRIGAELNSRGFYFKNGKWTSKGGGR